MRLHICRGITRTMRRLVLCSGKINRYGYRNIPSGIQIDNYLKNPILLHEHRAYKMPIGKLTDIRVDTDGEYKGMLTAIPEFDTDDETGKEVARKYEKGYLNACSIGFSPIEVSDAPEYILPGQRRSTVLSADLREVSIVNIPADAEAVAQLSADGDIDDLIPFINNHDNKPSEPAGDDTNQDPVMEKLNITPALLAKLSLPTNATADEVEAAINTLAASVQTLSAARVDSLITLGKTHGHVTADNEASYRKLAAADYDSVVALLSVAPSASSDTADSGKPAPASSYNLSIAEQLKGLLSAGSGAAEGETFLQLSQENPERLEDIRTSEPDYYAKLSAAYDKPVTK